MPRIHWQHGESVTNIADLGTRQVLVAGVGGNGSYAAEALVRLGFRKLSLADPDRLEVRNLGRQHYTGGHIGEPKALALARQLQDVSPSVEVSSHVEGLTQENCRSLVESADIVIDAIDDYRTKVVLSRVAQASQVPKVHTSGAGYKGSVTVFMPDGIDYETMFGLPSRGRKLTDVTDEDFVEHRARVAGIVGSGMFGSSVIKSIGETGRWPTLVVPCMCAGAIAAFEALKIVAGDFDRLIIAPRVLEFDLLRNIYTLREINDGAEE